MARGGGEGIDAGARCADDRRARARGDGGGARDQAAADRRDRRASTRARDLLDAMAARVRAHLARIDEVLAAARIARR